MGDETPHDEMDWRDWPKGRGRAAELTHQAVSFMFRGQYETARALLAQALADDPGYARAHTSLAYTLMYQGDANGGLAAAEKALKLAPEFAMAHTARGDCRARLGNVFGAVADYETALRLDPGNYRVYYNFACFWCEQGDGARCRRYLERALELCPPFFPDIIPRDPSLAAVADDNCFNELITAARKRQKKHKTTAK
jgi:Tfp pilus assembly protein PilF